MAEAWTETWTENWFAGLLADAVCFDILAQDEGSADFPTRNRFARISVTSATLSIEAAANCCLARMEYPQIAIRQLDKLSTLEKYAVLFSSRFGKEIDRGSRSFQVVGELISLRNRYVHPKIGKSEVRITVGEDGQKLYEKVLLHLSETSVLRLPLDMARWTGANSRSVISETILFFNHFFSDLCGLDAVECARLLSLFVKGQTGTACFLAAHEASTLRRVEEIYGHKVKFLKL